jgi:hypothetical protein
LIALPTDLRNFCTKENGSFWKFFGLEGGTDIVFPEETEVVDPEAWTSKPSIKYGEQTPLEKIILKSDNVGVINIKGEINLIYCVSYKTLGDTIQHHTGGIVTIAVPEGSGFLGNGQSIPLGNLKLQRPTFEWHNFAD